MRWIQGWGTVVREVLAGGEEDGAAGWQLRQVGTEPPLMGRVCSACQPTQAGAPPCRRLLRVWKMPIQGSIHLSDVGLLWCQTAKPVSIIQHQGGRIFGSLHLLCLTTYLNINESTHYKNLP